MISFALSDEQKMIRETIAAFALAEIRPAARAADETGAIPTDLIDKIWSLGLVQGIIPSEYGGCGDERSAVTGAIVAEELAFGDLAIALHALAPRLAAYPLLEAGTAAQRDNHLKALTGEKFVAATAGLMEPQFDFDPSEMQTTAREVENGYVLDGAKCYVPLGETADPLLVYAALDRELGLNGVAGFLLRHDTPGLTISAREKNMGINGLPTYGVQLEECRVGVEARIGGEQGMNFTRLLSESRVALAVMAVGVARAAFEYARDYAKERKAFGVPIATKQAIAFMLAEMATEVDAMRLLVWEAASRLDRSEDALKESSQARNYSAQACLAVADNAVQVLGGHGYIREHPVEMWLRNARGFAVFEGLTTV
jgi:alkylation response protein AidB-like acyl-CoA dehydrogenase